MRCTLVPGDCPGAGPEEPGDSIGPGVYTALLYSSRKYGLTLVRKEQTAITLSEKGCRCPPVRPVAVLYAVSEIGEKRQSELAKRARTASIAHCKIPYTQYLPSMVPVRYCGVRRGAAACKRLASRPNPKPCRAECCEVRGRAIHSLKPQVRLLWESSLAPPPWLAHYLRGMMSKVRSQPEQGPMALGKLSRKMTIAVMSSR